MRSVSRLSGPDALKGRVHYVLEDLFIRPAQLGGTALLVDDIYNTGASMRVYARALKDFAGVERVIGVNLAATRFNRGKDGHGLLKLDTTGLDMVWLDSDNTFHQAEDCPAARLPVSPELRFMCEREAGKCEKCLGGDPPRRKWWQVLFRC